MHYPTRPVDKDKAEQELVINIKKATSAEESAPKQKHVRSESVTIFPPSLATHRHLRMYRLYMGLPFFNILLERSSRPAHSIG